MEKFREAAWQHCAIGMAFLDEQTEKLQRKFRYRKKNKLLNAPSHKVLGNLLHMTEKVKNNLVIIFGKDFQSFKKRLFNKIERRIIFMEEINVRTIL